MKLFELLGVGVISLVVGAILAEFLAIFIHMESFEKNLTSLVLGVCVAIILLAMKG